eukprot:CAMPEP_0119428894 /NCGR_PEP_ID=MMETSP1335-20130426/41242_1 /TAXON_ID=259385 /ORGANISM="Chrysoculter rhomboideus, Strain RCC1486" /LENGTH=221 /DNA_ID=CAMNT_0007454595 /DNA_START=102 /DNA_END=765 /DNA_ORIENTATION=-
MQARARPAPERAPAVNVTRLLAAAAARDAARATPCAAAQRAMARHRVAEGAVVPRDAHVSALVNPLVRDQVVLSLLAVRGSAPPDGGLLSEHARVLKLMVVVDARDRELGHDACRPRAILGRVLVQLRENVQRRAEHILAAHAVLWRLERVWHAHVHHPSEERTARVRGGRAHVGEYIGELQRDGRRLWRHAREQRRERPSVHPHDLVKVSIEQPIRCAVS